MSSVRTALTGTPGTGKSAGLFGATLIPVAIVIVGGVALIQVTLAAPVPDGLLWGVLGSALLLLSSTSASAFSCPPC